VQWHVQRQGPLQFPRTSKNAAQTRPEEVKDPQLDHLLASTHLWHGLRCTCDGDGDDHDALLESLDHAFDVTSVSHSQKCLYDMLQMSRKELSCFEGEPMMVSGFHG
jgi:hypothetical protein